MIQKKVSFREKLQKMREHNKLKDEAGEKTLA